MPKHNRSPTLNLSGPAKKKGRSDGSNGTGSQDTIDLTHSSSPGPPGTPPADVEEEPIEKDECDPVKRLGEHLTHNTRQAAHSPDT